MCPSLPDGRDAFRPIPSGTGWQAGGTVPESSEIDGRNIVGLLEGKQPSPHEEFYYYYGAEIFAVRWRNWKLHFYQRESRMLGLGRTLKCEPPELYNLDQDPSESVNLSPREPELVVRLTGLAERFRAAMKPGRLPPRLPLGRPL